MLKTLVPPIFLVKCTKQSTKARAKRSGEDSRRLRIERTRWANFELGSPITLTVVFLILKAVPGVTIEYIIEGCHDRVPAELSRRLQWLESELFPSSSSRSGHKT
jgi:hypothetical protein